MEDIGPLGLYGHDSSIGLDIYDRLPNNSNLTPGMLSENIGYGSSHPIESIVLSILLYSEKEALSKAMSPAKLTGALENFLDPNHHLFGIAVGKHKEEGFMTVACMCLEFLSQDQV